MSDENRPNPITRDNCSSDIHFCLENAEELDIWGHLNVDKPSPVPRELRGNGLGTRSTHCTATVKADEDTESEETASISQLSLDGSNFEIPEGTLDSASLLAEKMISGDEE